MHMHACCTRSAVCPKRALTLLIGSLRAAPCCGRWCCLTCMKAWASKATGGITCPTRCSKGSLGEAVGRIPVLVDNQSCLQPCLTYGTQPLPPSGCLCRFILLQASTAQCKASSRPCTPRRPRSAPLSASPAGPSSKVGGTSYCMPLPLPYSCNHAVFQSPS